MKRREFVTSVLAAGIAAPVAAGGKQEEHQHTILDGLLANATVSFGGWPATFNRNNPPSPPPTPPPNLHALVPHTVTIREGGTVNYIVGGLHHIVVYGDGKQPDDVDVNNVITVPNVPPPLIDDSDRRKFVGIYPSLMVQDRVEVVHFPRRGLYLVICAVRPHFVNDKMYGWVKVVRNF
jgi:hypothetical protein